MVKRTFCCRQLQLALFSLFIMVTHGIDAHPQTVQEDNTKILRHYSAALTKLTTLLEDSTAKYIEPFKSAVFITESAYSLDAIDRKDFENQITGLTILARQWIKYNPISHYKFEDSVNVEENLALFKVIKDTISIELDKSIVRLLPYAYDFDDFFGQKAWSNMFVTKLLATHSGNCHSLPYLYKILADHLGASCWLSLAPDHIYIANRCKKIGWYNTELTSGTFPIDAWIMASGYLPVQAVQSGIYMDTLSNRQSIALCVLDLAKGYEHKTHNYTDGFILKCIDLSLQYFPLDAQAILLKAETLKHIYQRQKANNLSVANNTFADMQKLYLKLFDLGYREMPDGMYISWLQSVIKERDKYLNNGIEQIANPNK
jgi:hypothetical protein